MTIQEVQIIFERAVERTTKKLSQEPSDFYEGLLTGYKECVYWINKSIYRSDEPYGDWAWIFNQFWKINQSWFFYFDPI